MNKGRKTKHRGVLSRQRRTAGVQDRLQVDEPLKRVDAKHAGIYAAPDGVGPRPPL